MSPDKGEIRISGLDCEGGKTEVILPYSPDIPTLLAMFERFMRAYGYCFKGRLELVDDEEDLYE